MNRTMGVLIASFIVLAGVRSAPAQEVQTPDRAIPNQYIVVLDDRQVAAPDVPALAQAMARQQGARVLHIYERALRGFAAQMSATAAAALARNPRVRYVEQDSVMIAIDTQPNATWGLDRIDQ